MATFNRIVILGTLGQTPTLQETRNGKPFCRMSLATHGWKNKEGASSTTWHSVHVFGKQAETATKCLTKGGQVFIEGHMETSKSVDNEGQSTWKTWVTADRLTFMNNDRDRKDSSPEENRFELPEAIS